MSEKRFVLSYEKGNEAIFEDRKDVYPKRMTNKEVERKLNEQQTTITALKEENDILKQKLRKNYIANKQYEEMKRLQKENEQLRQELNDCEKFRHSIFKRMNELTDKLKEKEEDEKLYAQEIVELNKTKKELIEFNELGGDY